MKKNLTAILLAFLMTSSSFAACAKDTGETTGDSAAVPASENTAETVAEETEPEIVTDDLPERDFNDFDFQIYSRQSATHYAYLTEEMPRRLAWEFRQGFCPFNLQT